MKELPTFKDVDFRNNMQKVYVTEEDKEKFMEKVNRDVEVGELQWQQQQEATGCCRGNQAFGVCERSSW